MQHTDTLDDTGERLLPTWQHVTVAEHLHRYALGVSLAAGKTVLDVASGEGYGTNLLGTVAAGVVGLDLEGAAVRHATRKYGRESVRFVQGSAASLPFPDASFDFVVSFETIEHLFEQEAMLAELGRVLTDDGRLLISSPDKAHHGDRQGYVNDYHVQELHARDFLALIDRHFPHRTHLCQQVLTCSALWPEARREPLDVLAGTFEGFSRLSRLPEPSFHLVLAGRQPVPELPASLFDGTAVAQAFQDRQAEEIENLNAYVAALKQEIARRDASPAPAPAPAAPVQPETPGLLARRIGQDVSLAWRLARRGWQRLRDARTKG